MERFGCCKKSFEVLVLKASKLFPCMDRRTLVMRNIAQKGDMILYYKEAGCCNLLFECLCWQPFAMRE